MPPRTLKAPVGVWFSCLTHSSHPVRSASRGQAYCGVGGTVRRTSSAAASSSASVKSELGASIDDLRAGKDVSPLREIRRIDVVLALLRLVTGEALLGGIGDLRLLGIALGPELEAPAAGRGIFLGILDHRGHALARALDKGAVGDGEIVQVGDELAAVGIGAALLERGHG